MKRLIARFAFLLIAVCLLLACERTNKGATIVDPPSAPSYEYRVKSGDTLYSIAWRHEMNYVELARVNNIAHPYTIYPNQILKVNRAQVVAHTGQTASQGSTAGLKPVPSKETPPRASNTAPTAASKRPTAPASVSKPQSSGRADSSWAWPSRGKVSKRFGPKNKGMNFALDQGSEVHAARGGTVVYASTGIGGYRNLVIIRHNERYLSAYSLDQGVLVREGQSVGSGDIIARIAGEPSRDLHFEVRDQGEPVDPMKVLETAR